MNKDILIVDDEADIRSLLKGILEDEDYACRSARNDETVFEALSESVPSLVLLDVWLEDSKLDGVGILKKLSKNYPDLPVVMMSGHGTIETAVSAIKVGAYDFIEKPFDIDRILMVIERALEFGKLKEDNRKLREKAYYSCADIHGSSPQIGQLRQTVKKAATTDSRVLITGAQGTGKNVIARMLHRLSHRQDGPYISLNCAAVDPDELEVALFGLEADDPSAYATGVLEQAEGGTLVLDEIAEIPLEVQGKLVRVLQDNSFIRVKGSASIPMDIRLIAATNQNLEDKIADKTFREDLFYRLNVVPLHIPALVERRSDIPVLIEHFLESNEIFDENNIAKTGTLTLADDALAILQGYAWPGNVRQLKNVIEWLVIMYGNQSEPDNSFEVTAELLPPEVRDVSRSFGENDIVVELMSKPLREAREIFERKYLLAQIERFDGNVSKTAGFVGMERSALHRKLKTLDVQDDDTQNNKETVVGG